MKKMTKSQYAAYRQVNKSTVTRWVQAGRIVLDESGKIDPDVADKQLGATGSPLPHHVARSEQIEEGKAAQGSEGAGPATAANGNTAILSVEEIGRRMKLARLATEEAKAETAMLERAEKARELARRADADFVMDDLGNVLGNLLIAWPNATPAPSPATKATKTASMPHSGKPPWIFAASLKTK